MMWPVTQQCSTVSGDFGRIGCTTRDLEWLEQKVQVDYVDV